MPLLYQKSIIVNICTIDELYCTSYYVLSIFCKLLKADSLYIIQWTYVVCALWIHRLTEGCWSELRIDCGRFIAFTIMSCWNRSVMSQVLPCKVKFWLPSSCTCSFSLLPCYVPHVTDTLTYSSHAEIDCRPVGRQSDVKSSHHKRAIKPFSWTLAPYRGNRRLVTYHPLPSCTSHMMEPPSLPLLLHSPSLPFSFSFYLSPAGRGRGSPTTESAAGFCLLKRQSPSACSWEKCWVSYLRSMH